MELRLRGSDRDAELAGDLFVFIAFDIMKYEHLSCSGRELCDRGLEVEQLARRKRRAHGSCDVVEPSSFAIRFSQPSVSPCDGLSVVQHYVDCQPMQPGRKRRSRP